MRMPLCASFVAFVLIVLLGVPRTALAWGNTGHEAVACVAWKQLDQVTKDKVFSLLRKVPSIKSADKSVTIPGFAEWSAGLPAGLSTDEQHMYIFMRAATWPDSIKHTFFHDSDTPPLHPSTVPLRGFDDRNSYGFWHFDNTPSGTALTPHVPVPKMPESCSRFPSKQLSAVPQDASKPNAATQIVALSTSLATSKNPAMQAYDLVWLEHMVGDLHQPLHASVRFVDGIGDSGGNCVAISLPAAAHARFQTEEPAPRAPEELHALWDDLPGAGSQMNTQLAVTYAETLAPAPTQQAALTDPNIWAQESSAIAIKDAYVDPVGVGLGTPQPYVITDAYYDRAYADAQDRIALAGARLANLLILALNH